jgi:hypothetical protein
VRLRTDHSFGHGLGATLINPQTDAERRLGERSPGPFPLLSVTVVIGITSRPTFPTCDTLAGPDGVQFVDLGIYASWWTNLRTNKSWQMISG